MLINAPSVWRTEKATWQDLAGEMPLCITLIIILESLVLFKLYSFVQLFFFFFYTCFMPDTVLGIWDI